MMMSLYSVSRIFLGVFSTHPHFIVVVVVVAAIVVVVAAAAAAAIVVVVVVVVVGVPHPQTLFWILVHCPLLGLFLLLVS